MISFKINYGGAAFHGQSVEVNDDDGASKEKASPVAILPPDSVSGIDVGESKRSVEDNRFEMMKKHWNSNIIPGAKAPYNVRNPIAKWKEENGGYKDLKGIIVKTKKEKKTINIGNNNDYRIAKYNDLQSNAKNWNDAEFFSRGLIYTSRKGARAINVNSYPMVKFFNLGQLGKELIPNKNYMVAKKYDGSGIYIFNGLVTTMGNFNSKEAIIARKYLERVEDLMGKLTNPDLDYFNYTIFGEIVDPRIDQPEKVNETNFFITYAYDENGNPLNVQELGIELGLNYVEYDEMTVPQLLDHINSLDDNVIESGNRKMVKEGIVAWTVDPSPEDVVIFKKKTGMYKILTDRGVKIQNLNPNKYKEFTNQRKYRNYKINDVISELNKNLDDFKTKNQEKLKKKHTERIYNGLIKILEKDIILVEAFLNKHAEQSFKFFNYIMDEAKNKGNDITDDNLRRNMRLFKGNNESGSKFNIINIVRKAENIEEINLDFIKENML